ncbi:unnamed protein product, partial [Larinioides sclopetarius]
MPRSLKPHPAERPNWNTLNEGQKRYAVEQWQLARVRRGLPIDHPIPSLDPDLVPEDVDQNATLQEGKYTQTSSFPD